MANNRVFPSIPLLPNIPFQLDPKAVQSMVDMRNTPAPMPAQATQSSPKPKAKAKGKGGVDAKGNQTINEPAFIIGASGQMYGMLGEQAPEEVKITPTDQPYNPQAEQGRPQQYVSGGVLEVMGYDPRDPNVQNMIKTGQLNYGQSLTQTVQDAGMPQPFTPTPQVPQQPQIASSMPVGGHTTVTGQVGGNNYGYSTPMPGITPMPNAMPGQPFSPQPIPNAIPGQIPQMTPLAQGSQVPNVMLAHQSFLQTNPTISPQDQSDLAYVVNQLNQSIGKDMTPEQALATYMKITQAMQQATQAPQGNPNVKITPPRTGDAGLANDNVAPSGRTFDEIQAAGEYQTNAEREWFLNKVGKTIGPSGAAIPLPSGSSVKPTPVASSTTNPSGPQATSVADVVHGNVAVTLNPLQVGAIQSIFPQDQWTTAMYIAAAESKGNNASTGSAGEIGLFQIHPVNWPGLSQALGIPINAQTLQDPYVNAMAAKVIFDQAGGWGGQTGNPWATAPTVLRYLGVVR